MYRCLLIVWSFFVCLAWISQVSAEDRVLVVHSYHHEMPHVTAINQGIKKALADRDVEYEYFYMDTKRRPSPEWAKKMGELAKERVHSFRPKVVVTVDDNAQEYFARYFVGQDEPQFVFCAVDFDISRYGFPARNVTGVLQAPFLAQSIDLLLQIKPGVKNIRVLCDNSPSGQAVVRRLKNQTRSSVNILSFDFLTTFEDWKSRITRYQQHADALAIVLYHQLPKDENNHEITDPKTVMAWMLEHNRLPTIGFYDFVIQDGLLCGVVWSATVDGFAVGKKVSALLDGNKAGDLPLTDSPLGAATINLVTARSLGITVPFEVIESADHVIR